MPDPSVLDAEWKGEVQRLPDLCFADIFIYLINIPSDYTLKRISRLTDH